MGPRSLPPSFALFLGINLFLSVLISSTCNAHPDSMPTRSPGTSIPGSNPMPTPNANIPNAPIPTPTGIPAVPNPSTPTPSLPNPNPTIPNLPVPATNTPSNNPNAPIPTPTGIPAVPNPSNPTPSLPNPNPTTPSVPVPTTPTPTVPSPSNSGRCPRDVLKVGLCVRALNLVDLTVGKPPVKPCCALVQGLVDLEAAACLCTSIRASILGINLNVPVDLTLLLNICNRKVPRNFQCPNTPASLPNAQIPTPTTTPTVPNPTNPTPSLPIPNPTTPSLPVPTTPTPTVPSPSNSGRCPRDVLKVGLCVRALNLVDLKVGKPPVKPCCALVQGLADLEAAACLCTSIRASVLGINLNVPIDLTLLLNVCNRKVPRNFQCPNTPASLPNTQIPTPTTMPTVPNPTNPTPSLPIPNPTTPSLPVPTTPSPIVPSPSNSGRCPRDVLKVGLCVRALNLVDLTVGKPPVKPCCALVQGLVDLEAAACLCTSIRASVLGINLNVPIDLTLLLNVCNRKVPRDFRCPNTPASLPNTPISTPTTTPTIPNPTNPTPSLPVPNPTTPSLPVPTTPTPIVPSPSNSRRCPRDTLKVGLCVRALNMVDLKVGKPPVKPCCALVEGLVDLEAAACLCTSIRASVLGIKVDASINLTLLLNVCKRNVPRDFRC